MAKEIVVIEGSWNMIGEVEETKEGITINSASCIRYWGTKAGLGQIALTGPTKETILDFTGTVKVPTHAVLFRILCKEEAKGGKKK